VPSVTAGTIKEKVQRAMGDPSGTYIEDEDVFGWIFDAQQDIAKLTECFTADFEITSVADQELYVLDVALLKVLRLTYEHRKLERITITQLDTVDPNRDIAGNNGVPTHFYLDGGSLGLWVKPSTGVIDCIRIRARVLPTNVISADADILQIPDLFQQDIYRYCLIQARHKDESPEMLVILIEEWRQKIMLAKSLIDNPHDGYQSVTDIETLVDYTSDWYT